jgi:hypothetical protein
MEQSMARAIISMLNEAEKQPQQDKKARIAINVMLKHAKALFGRKHKQDRRVKILDVKPFFGTKWLRFDSESTGSDNNMYGQTVIFYSMDFVDEKDGAHPQVINLVPKHGKNEVVTKWAAPIDASQTPCAVRCSCSDFQYRWEWYLKKVGSLAGGFKARPYTRKTKTRPSVNPMKTPGCCKHIYQLALLINATYPQLMKNLNA